MRLDAWVLGTAYTRKQKPAILAYGCVEYRNFI